MCSGHFFLLSLHGSICFPSLYSVYIYICPLRIVAAVQLENTSVNEIEIMLYENSYIRNSKFPKECIFHPLLFIMMFILVCNSLIF
jgi:hypothetical protein